MTAAGPVVLGVTGSIAAYKACDIIRLLKKDGIDVQVILTKEGERFVTPLLLQTLSKNRVITDMFAVPDEWDPAHTALADRARAILIAPATANSIGKLAAGIADDMLTCTVYATNAPVVIAPAMNDHMYTHPVTQENIRKLQKIGYQFVGPVTGMLACGREGTGHLAGVDEIVSAVKKVLS